MAFFESIRALWDRIKRFFTGDDEHKLINIISEKILRYSDRYRSSGNVDAAERCKYFAEKVQRCENLAQARAVEKEFLIFVKENDEPNGSKRSDLHRNDHYVDTEDESSYDDDSDDSDDDEDVSDDDSDDDDFSDNS